MIEEERTTCWDGNYMKVVAKAHNAPKKKKKREEGKGFGLVRATNCWR